ncbi:histidine triad nucleotide-binding protein [Pseudomaricurvus alkylphenolicus]|uniref:histidine triad nucleotide-binding protein n=1 Tax=Pseudomaricurvus alkylphenolicus TaxID=1306991 RepID=UPI00142389D2|nr:histidine triad nucleotide-binding protein [Pseudomaricurvus alkylphenolicus]NIB43167.1 histidine triad nucleotide-binding protein [Pseudomaricurvus alkylphenolicus]
MSEDSIFTRIMNGEIPSDKVYEDDDCICIKDIAPKAPVHLLLIPRKPIPRLVDATAEDQALLGKLMVKAGEIANEHGVGDAFRLIVNNGEQAGQTVFHLHLHILGGKLFSESQLGF